MDNQRIPLLFHRPAAVFAAVFAVFTLCAQGALAETRINETAVRSAVNSLKFVRGIGKAVKLGVVFEPTSGQGQAEARQIAEIIGSLSKSGAVKIPMTVDVAGVAEVPGGNYDVLLITAGMSPHFEGLAGFARRNHVFNIGFDRACAQSGACTIAIEADAGVEIFLNEKTMKESGFDVDAAFRYMANRI